MPQERECHGVVGLYELVCEALGTNEHHCHGLVPQPAQATPGSCHHVELVLVACSHKNPLLPYRLKNIVVDLLNVYLFHIYIIFNKVKLTFMLCH